MDPNDINVAASVARPAQVNSTGFNAVPDPEPRGGMTVAAIVAITHHHPLGSIYYSGVDDVSSHCACLRRPQLMLRKDRSAIRQIPTF